MTVAGGYQLETKFGSFQVKIGPYINGGKKVTECQGVNLIAGNLDKQDLDEVNEELRAMDLLDPSVPLPKYAGGGEVVHHTILILFALFLILLRRNDTFSLCNS